MEKANGLFTKGLNNRIEPQSIARGAASDSINWVTKGDKIELRRGSKMLGTDVAGAGASYIHTARKADATEVLFRKRGRKLEYFDSSLAVPDWVECGTDMFPAAAENDEPSFSNYNSLSGAQLFISSANSSIYKVMVANPGQFTDLVQTTFRGKIRIKNGRMFLWQREASTNRDLTGLYGSYIDKDDISKYTQIASEVIGGSGVTRAGTLAFKAAGAKRTCFGVTFTDGTETFVDDYNGVLTGSAGGTGTINYTTGAYSVTFASAPAPVTATYYWEDSTSAGIADFTKSSPRTAGQGFILRQDDGGGTLQNVMGYRDNEYCLHELKSWVLNLTNDDTNATNLPYRSKVGIPNWQAACETGDGVYYVDDTDENDPHVRLLTLADPASVEVIPVSKSGVLDLSGYRFEKAVMKEWGRYIVLACRTASSTVNNRLLAFDRDLKTWDVHDYMCASLAILDGTLIGGDSATYNVYELFSGFDDDDSTIPNYWNGNLDSLDIEGLKKSKRFKVQGEIYPDQAITFSLSVDKSDFVDVLTISGDGAYVDKGHSVTVGAITIGRLEIGGGGVATAYNYEAEIKLNLDRFEQVMLRISASGIGYASVSLYDFKDVRYKGRKVPTKYRI
jgi:hypothetical protein